MERLFFATVAPSLTPTPTNTHMRFPALATTRFRATYPSHSRQTLLTLTHVYKRANHRPHLRQMTKETRGPTSQHRSRSPTGQALPSSFRPQREDRQGRSRTAPRSTAKRPTTDQSRGSSPPHHSRTGPKQSQSQPQSHVGPHHFRAGAEQTNRGRTASTSSRRCRRANQRHC